MAESIGEPRTKTDESAQDGDVDLRELFVAIWTGKWLLIAFTVVFAIASALYAYSLPNLYTSTVVLAPTESSGGGIGKLAGQFGGLASLAGVNLNSGEGSKTAEALEILTSWAFIEEFIQEKNLAPKVFAVTGWDPETKELIYDTSLYDPEVKVWTREPKSASQVGPSSWELFEKFSGYIRLNQDKSTGFTSLSIEYFSPEIAKEWVDQLVYKINTKLQARDSREAQRNIDFLNQQIEQTPLTSMQSVFYSLIEEQTKTLMLAKGSTEYVFRVVNEPRVPEQRSKPKRALIVLVGAVLGAFLGVLLALFRYFLRK